ncbi:MAG: hypothetical protein ACMG55_09410 [Microcoleus sp.]
MAQVHLATYIRYEYHKESMLNKESFAEIIKDRTVVILLLAVFVLCIILAGVSITGFHISDVQVPVRYTDFGATNTYRNKWYYLLAFPLFALLIAVLHGLIVSKLVLKSRQLAIGFALATIVMLIFAIAITAAVFNLVSVSL